MIDFLKKNSGYFAMLLAVIGFGAGPPFVTLALKEFYIVCLLYTSPSPRDVEESRMPSSA